MKARPVLILGAGGHGKVVADALIAGGREVLGFLDRNADTRAPFGLALLGSDDSLVEFEADAVEIANGIGSTGDVGARRALFERGKAAGFRFVTVIHPQAVVSETARLREGAQIMAGAVVQAEAEIGENAIVNTGAVVDHDCRIGAHCHIGVGASLIQSLTLGDHCLVAAGAAVVDSFGSGSRLLGVPAKVAP